MKKVFEEKCLIYKCKSKYLSSIFYDEKNVAVETEIIISSEYVLEL